MTAIGEVYREHNICTIVFTNMTDQNRLYSMCEVHTEGTQYVHNLGSTEFSKYWRREWGNLAQNWGGENSLMVSIQFTLGETLW
jgi:hypothetical protein